MQSLTEGVKSLTQLSIQKISSHPANNNNLLDLEKEFVVLQALVLEVY